MEVSCENPNQSAAPSEGWTSFTTARRIRLEQQHGLRAGRARWSALLSTDAGAAVGAGENLQYTPPGGSTLAGGSVDVDHVRRRVRRGRLGHRCRLHPRIRIQRLERLLPMRLRASPPAQRAHQRLRRRARAARRPWRGLLHRRGLRRAGGQACDEGGSDGAWSLVQLWWANFLLSNGATPGASGIGGTLLSPECPRHSRTHVHRERPRRPRRLHRHGPDRRQNALLRHSRHQRRRVRPRRHERRRADVRLQPAMQDERVGRLADQHDHRGRRAAHVEGHRRGRRAELERRLRQHDHHP